MPVRAKAMMPRTSIVLIRVFMLLPVALPGNQSRIMRRRGPCLFPSPPQLFHVLALRLSRLDLLINYSKTVRNITNILLKTSIFRGIGLRDREIPPRPPDVAEMQPCG